MWPASEDMAFSPKIEVKSELLSCRACLGTDRLYNMHQHGLVEPYRQLVGVEARETSPLPVHLCVWCRCVLLKFAAFRERCRRSEVLLQNLAVLHTVITAEDLSTIDRYTQRLLHPYMQIETCTINCTDDDKKLLIPDETNEHIENYATFDDEESITPLDDNVDDDVKNVDIVNTGMFRGENNLTIEVKCEKRIPSKRTRKRVVKKTNENASSSKTNLSYKKVKTEVNLVETSKKTPIKVSKSNKKSEAKPKVRKTQPKVNNLGTLSEIREKFSQQYDVDIIVMTKEDEMKEMLDRKNSNKYSQAHNKCEECYKGFIHEDTLKRHMKDKHDPSLEHVCEFCRFRFSNKITLRSHHKRHHRYKYICRVCKVVTKIREHALQHSKMHTEKPQCKYCAKTFNSKGTAYHSHVRKKHAAELPWCRLCGDAFMCTKTHMERLHKEALNPDRTLLCETCKTQFLNTQALHSHASTQASCSNLKSCVHCGHSFDAEKLLRDHVLDMHKRQFPCSKCNKVFRHECIRNNHMLNKHSDAMKSGAKPHKSGGKPCARVVPSMCDVCGKVTSSVEALRVHQRAHTGERPYPCSRCDKAFTQKAALGRHELVHTGAKPYMCPQCGKSFTQSGSVTLHVRTVHLKMPAPYRDRRKKTNHSASDDSYIDFAMKARMK